MGNALAEAYPAIAAPAWNPHGLFYVNAAQNDDEPDVFDLPVEYDEPQAAAPEAEEEPDEPVVAGGSVALRHYQQAAVTGVLRQFKGDKAADIEPVQSTLVVAATGTGKSVCIADLARRNENWGHGTLLLVHRDELIKQLIGSCARVGIHALKEKAQERALPGFGMFSQTVVASVQTLRGARLEQWPRDTFKLIITDEAHHACFPAGELVDGKPIESLKIGDYVNSYNHETNNIEKRRVSHLFKNPVAQLVRVHLSNGDSFVCTHNHPIAVQTKKGVEYLPAIVTECYTVVHEQNIYQAERMRSVWNDLSAAQLEPLHGADVFGAVQSHSTRSAGENGNSTLSRMWERCCAIWSQGFGFGTQWPRVLQRRMQVKFSSPSQFRDNGGNESRSCVSANEEKQSDVKPRNFSQNESNCEGSANPESCGQWQHDKTANDAFRGARMADGSRNINGAQARRKVAFADGLQGGYWQRRFEDCNRSGRRFSQGFEGQSRRQNEGRISDEIRVDSIEILEPRSSGRFAEVCPDGFVYNIEVEGNHNYFVNGILVHNCARSYQNVYDYFGVGRGARHVGFTATADRLDGIGLGKVFESLAFEYNIRDAIHDPAGPFLVPIEACPIETNPVIDLKALRVTAGDFNAGDLEKAINDNIGVLVNAIVDNNAIGDRRTIAFTPDVSSAQALALALQDVGIKAGWIAGNSPDRAQVLEAHRAGEFQVLVNCMILTEGYDDPEVSCILVCRPTKSRALYSQMVGRGTRLHPESNKQNCRVVDFAFMTGTHQLVSPVDLYDNSETDDTVVERARELVEKGEERDIDAALERAQNEFEDGERVRIKRRMVQSRLKTFDLIGSYELLGLRQKADYNWNDTKPATQGMIKFARSVGVELADDAGFGATKRVLDAVSARRKYGLCTMKQIGLCIRLGAEPTQARKFSFEEATAFISSNKTW